MKWIHKLSNQVYQCSTYFDASTGVVEMLSTPDPGRL